MKEFAKILSTEIDTTEPFILIGASFGGMLAVEISEILSPEKTIIISSAKNRKELPFRYKFQRVIPLYEIFPPGVLKWGAKRMQPIVEPDRNKNKETFKSMLDRKEPKYMKRTIRMLCKWDRKENSTTIIHIHGTKDHTLPYRKIENPDYTIEEGSHMMTLTRGEDISQIINTILAFSF